MTSLPVVHHNVGPCLVWCWFAVGCSAGGDGVGKAPYVDTAKKPGRIFMQRLLTEVEKAEIVEREWAKARAKNPKVVMRVDVQDETDESGKPKVSVVVAF